MHTVELTPTAGDPPLLLLLMVVVTILVLRAGFRNFKSSKGERHEMKSLRDRTLLWAKGVGLMLAGGVSVIWPAGRLIGAW